MGDSHIMVFCREPIKNQVKTRLIGRYGSEIVTGMYCEMVERTLRTAIAVREASGAEVSLWVAADTGHATVREWSRRYDAKIYVQRGEGLGARMFHALSTLVTQGARAILIGTDCPAFTSRHLQDALSALDNDAAWVFTPAEDGGYVLVGTRTPSEVPFRDMQWSQPDVMQATRDRLSDAKMSWHEMPMLWDVDEPRDVERAIEAGLLADRKA
jgi:uncharacterized protein